MKRVEIQYEVTSSCLPIHTNLTPLDKRYLDIVIFASLIVDKSLLWGIVEYVALSC